MSDLRQEMINAIARNIEVFGTSRTFRVVAQGAVDPNNPGTPPGTTETDIPVNAFIYDYEEQYIDGTTVRRGDRIGIFHTRDLDILQLIAIGSADYSYLIDGSIQYTVVSANFIEMNGQPIMFKMQLRG